jgi:hypothetical protein
MFVYFVPLLVFFLWVIYHALLAIDMIGPDQPAWVEEHVAIVEAVISVASIFLAGTIVSLLIEKLPIFPRAMKRPSIEHSSDSELSE